MFVIYQKINENKKNEDKLELSKVKVSCQLNINRDSTLHFNPYAVGG